MFRKRIKRNFGANIFSQVIVVLSQIICVPFFIYYWGAVKYGEWLILTTVLAYLAMSDVGFTTIAANEMAMEADKKEKNHSLSIFQSTWFLVSIIGLFLLLLIPIFWYLPMEEYLNIQSIPHRVVVIVLSLLVISVVISLQLGLVNSGFNADGNNYISVWMNNLAKVFEIIFIVVGLYFGAEQIYIATLLVFSKTICYFLALYKLKKLSPWIKFGIFYASFKKIKEMLPNSFLFLSFSIGNAIKNQGLLTVVSILLGPIAVVSFSTTRTLANLIYQSRGIIINSIQPEISRAYGVNNLILAKKIHQSSSQIGLWISICGLFFLGIFGVKIINIWTLGRLSIDTNFMILMLLSVFLNSIWIGSSIVPIAINKISRLSPIYLLNALLSVIFSYLFILSFGLSGIPVALITIDLITIFFVIRLTLILLDDNFKDFIFKIIMPPLYLFKANKESN